MATTIGNSSRQRLCLLIDNGSVLPEPTLHLRRVARALEIEIGCTVHGLSLLHSNKVDSGYLQGSPAELLEPVLNEMLMAGQREFVIVPQFLGPSRALSSYVPSIIERLLKNWPDAQFHLSSCLYDKKDNSASLIAGILEDRLLDDSLDGAIDGRSIILVDHGTPVVEVNQVRHAVAAELGERLGKPVIASSMERRSGAEYDFNEPLLESVLERPELDSVIVSLLFFSEGRHAGPDGDIFKICEASSADRISIARPIGIHPSLIKLLARRYHEALPYRGSLTS